MFTSEVTFKDYFYSEQMEIIGHNIIGYDIPALKKLWNVDFNGKKVTDTLVMSRLAEPSRQGGHSLDSWGEQLGCPKGDYNDWLNFSQDMVEYCKQDVRVNELVYKKLISYQLAGFRGESLDLEHQVQDYYCRTNQERLALRPEEKHLSLLAKLKEKKLDLEDKCAF